jgi:predicted transcriptional regulator
MKRTMIIQTPEQIKAISNPLRMQILEAFSHRPMTTKQMAAELGAPPTKLYHHVNMLEHAGLVTLVRTMKKRGTTEKYFKTAARRFTVDRGLFRSRSEFRSSVSGMKGMITRQLEQTIKEVQQSIEYRRKGKKQTRHHVIFSSARIRTSLSGIKVLNKEISKLLKKHEATKPVSGSNEYRFTLVLCPVRKRKKQSAGRRHNKRSKQ